MTYLVVDDDPTLRMLMVELLHTEWDCTVTEASDGLEAWQLLDSGLRPDLCIFDMRMPRLGGLELVAKVLSDPRFTAQKIMICSTENDRPTVIKAASLGINDYLLKPFLADHFIAHVRKHCGAPDKAAPPEPLEPLPIALARLRIKKKKYLELLGVLTKDVTDLVAMLELSSGKDPGDIKLRLGAIRGAGLTLGAADLVAVIARLEHANSTVYDASLQSYRDAIEAENKRIIAASAKIAAE